MSPSVPMLATVRPPVRFAREPAAPLAPSIVVATGILHTRSADAAVTSALPRSALQETCERSAIALKTGVFVMRFSVAEHVRRTPMLSGTCATVIVRCSNEPTRAQDLVHDV